MNPGETVQVYGKHGWEPATLVKLGRKKATVTFKGKTYNSHFPVSALRPYDTLPKSKIITIDDNPKTSSQEDVKPVPKPPPPPGCKFSEPVGEVTVNEEKWASNYFIRIDSKPVAMVLMAYPRLAQVVAEALRKDILAKKER